MLAADAEIIWVDDHVSSRRMSGSTDSRSVIGMRPPHSEDRPVTRRSTWPTFCGPGDI
jgi:hypothetical protein